MMVAEKQDLWWRPAVEKRGAVVIIMMTLLTDHVNMHNDTDSDVFQISRKFQQNIC